MAKKAKAVKQRAQLIVDDLLVGEFIPDLHGEEIEIDDDLIEQMRRFEKESKKNAIWKNKITGSFLFWQMNEEKKAEETIEELEEEGWGTEEADMEEAIEEVKLDEPTEGQVKVAEAELELAKEDYRT